MVYVKLPNVPGGFRDTVLRKIHEMSHSIRRHYPAAPEEADRAIMLMSVATIGAGPSLLIAVLFAVAGGWPGAAFFFSLFLMWPLWWILVTRFPGRLQLTAHLFVFFTSATFHLPIAFSNGLHSPVFSMQILTPLAAILVLGWKGFRIWGSFSLIALFAWYLPGIPTSDAFLIREEESVRVFSNFTIFFSTLAAILLLLSNRQKIFRTQAMMEAEMQRSQAVIGGIVSGQMEERQRLLKELQLDFGPRLARIEELQNQLLARSPLSPDECEVLRKRLRQVGTEITRISQDLPFEQAGEVGLRAAIANLCSHLENAAGVRIAVHIPPGPRIPLDTRNIHIYRILQEAFHNILRHARAQSAVLHLRIEAGQVVAILLEDDGLGLGKRPPGTLPSGQGLQNITDRVALLNGHFSIDSPPSGGTRLRITFPDAVRERLQLPIQ